MNNLYLFALQKSILRLPAVKRPRVCSGLILIGNFDPVLRPHAWVGAVEAPRIIVFHLRYVVGEGSTGLRLTKRARHAM